MPHQHQQDDPQSISMGFSSSSRDPSFEEAPSYLLGPYGQPQSQGSHTPFQNPASSSPDYIPPVGEMTHAPSSHFVSSGSFDFGGGSNEGLGELDTAGLLPNLGSQPLEMTELELESSPGSETLASPREYGHYPVAATHGPAGPAGRDPRSADPLLICLTDMVYTLRLGIWLELKALRTCVVRQVARHTG